MGDEQDFLDEIVEERTTQNPNFPDLVEAALHTRQLVRTLAEMRKRAHLSQKAVALRMGTSQEAVSRLESGLSDPRLSTVERYAHAVGRELELA